MGLLKLPFEQLVIGFPWPPIGVKAPTQCAPEPHVASTLIERFDSMLLGEYPLAAHLVGQVVALGPMR